MTIHYSTALPSYYFGAEKDPPPAQQRGSPRRTALSSLLTPADVLLDLDAPTKSRALYEAARFIATRHGLNEADIHASLSAREKVGSTGLGFGIAIPHARVKGLPHPIAAFVRMKSAIDFGAPDDKPVSDMLVLLVPPAVADEYLQLLAGVAEMFSDREFRERLRTRADAAALHALLAGQAEP
jgi:PTS system nitrogen regulatory IIA component